MTTRPLADDVTPIAMHVSQRVRTLLTSVRVSDLCITQPGIVTYLRTIAPDKLELALVHALDVGVCELARRRPR